MKASEMFPVKAAKSIMQPRSLDEKAGVWKGLILDIMEHPGKNDKKAWVRYTVEGEGGIAFTTFSSTDAQFAQGAMESGKVVEIQWSLNAYDGKSIDVIDAVKVEKEFDKYAEGRMAELKKDMKP